MKKILLICVLAILFVAVSGVGLYSYYIRPVDNKKK